MSSEASLCMITIPWFVSDKEFVDGTRKFSSDVEVLDCSRCINLTQEAFSQLSREETVFPKLKHLIVPENSPYPDLVYECLSFMTPVLEQLTNVRQNVQNTCDQLRCLSYFKKSNMKVLQDNPIACYGRMSVHSSTQSEKQKRQRWEQDLAKVAISCQKIEAYKCCGGRGYLDDKSMERLSVLMPGLIELELRRCSISDEGFAKFFAYNKSNGIVKMLLDDAGRDITDKSLKLLSDNCPLISSLSLLRLDKVTKYGVENLLRSCPNLLELGLGSSKGSHSEEHRGTFDENVFVAISAHCSQLRSLKLHSFDLSFKNISKILLNPRAFANLGSLSFHDCQIVGSMFMVEFLAQLQQLSELSFIDCRSVLPETVVGLIVKMTRLKRLTLFCQHKSFYSDVAPMAKGAYTMLTSENGGRFKLSSVEHLTVQGVSGQFLRLLTALCSNVVTLDFRLKMLPKIKGSCVMDCVDLVEALTPCEFLTSLEITSSVGFCSDSKQFVSRPKLSDEFFATILRCLTRLSKLHVDFSLEDVGEESMKAFVRDSGSLRHLSLNVAGSAFSEEFFRKAMEDSRTGRCATAGDPPGQEGGSLAKVVLMYLKPLKGQPSDDIWI